MALNTYDELVKSIVNWSYRGDALELIPDFIALAEYEMFNNAITQLRVRELESTTLTAISSRFTALPAGFEKARSMKLITGNGYCPVKFQVPEQLLRQVSTGQPRFFTVVGNEIEFDREPNSEYDIQMQFYKKSDPITKDNQTNEVLTGYSNIYLYGALHQLFLRYQDLEEATKYALKFQDAIKGANKADKKAGYGAAPAMRAEGAII